MIQNSKIAVMKGAVAPGVFPVASAGLGRFYMAMSRNFSSATRAGIAFGHIVSRGRESRKLSRIETASRGVLRGTDQ